MQKIQFSPVGGDTKPGRSAVGGVPTAYIQLKHAKIWDCTHPMQKILWVFFCSAFPFGVQCISTDSLIQFTMYDDVKIAMDIPSNYSAAKETMVIFYALANGNSTTQAIGKKTDTISDWRLNIQHIKAQTVFVREELPEKNIVLVYLENDFKSWPFWKTKHTGYVREIQHIVDTIFSEFNSGQTSICLNGHSGGGRFIFGFFDGVKNIPKYITRIVFLDSNYGYEHAYGIQINKWLKANKNASLQVFAYDDSEVELNGKRIVSDTGGTWYRSHLMLKDLSPHYQFKMTKNDSLIIYKSSNSKIGFYLKINPEREIFHSRQVELNGFIHSILAGTKRESVNYRYYGRRAYEDFIE